MKYSNPNTLALYVAIIVSTIFFLVENFTEYLFLGQINWYLIIVNYSLLFVITFFIFKYSLEEFIYKKINLIYKNLTSRKSILTKNNHHRFNFSKDILAEVNKEVTEINKDKSEEIEQLKKLETYRREFIANLSHELKTPIFNIQGYVLTLLDNQNTQQEVATDFLQRTEKNIDRMISIIDDLETISKLESNEVKFEYTSFDIIELVKDVYYLMETKASKKNINLQLEDTYEKLMVRADRDNIQNVLVNLIDNSIKYNNEGGRTRISFSEIDNKILVEVSDNGIGIDLEHQKRLFERFYRVDKHRSREQGGSGLGLSIVKHIIEAHNQTINLKSTPGKGSSFVFSLDKTK